MLLVCPRVFWKSFVTNLAMCGHSCCLFQAGLHHAWVPLRCLWSNRTHFYYSVNLQPLHSQCQRGKSSFLTETAAEFSGICVRLDSALGCYCIHYLSGLLLSSLSTAGFGHGEEQECKVINSQCIFCRAWAYMLLETLKSTQWSLNILGRSSAMR